ncbi:hypothetical protein H6H02_09900 [Coleofasciculus sp. FACHB-1120]|nr:hypothetical protein [Coleofasciculus sp. FACHB-1120]
MTARIELPGYLNDLVTALPPGGYYTVDRLIDNHTLLPFYPHSAGFKPVGSISGKPPPGSGECAAVLRSN